MKGVQLDLQVKFMILYYEIMNYINILIVVFIKNDNN